MSDFENAVAVRISMLKFEFWSQIRIERALDNFDTVELHAAFDPDDPFFKSTFKPFSYQPLSVTVNETPLFSGTMAVVTPSIGVDKSEVRAAAYALPGVLGECTATGSGLPTEYRLQTVHQIAATLAEPFGINVVPLTGPGLPFKVASLGPGQKIMPFLADLAKQRGQIITNNVNGDLVFQTGAGVGSPVGVLEQGRAPLVNVIPNFNPGQYYSEITGLKPTKIRNKLSTQFTWRNTLLPGVYRPYMFEAPDVSDVEVVDAVNAKAGRMWGNAVTYTAAVATWRDMLGNLWAPNTFVSVVAPGAMIYKPYTFLIRRVTLRKEAHRETAELDLVLPGAFTGLPPGVLPWDG